MSSSSNNIPIQIYGPMIGTKAAAVLSICGSTFIIQEVLLDPRKRSSSVMHRILCIMSFFDIMFSIALFFGTWAIPAETENIWYPMGNEMTCRIQGFFVQMCAMITPFLNAALAFYYLLVIRYGWKEEEVRKKCEKWIYGIGFTLAIGTATLALAFNLYEPASLWCWIARSLALQWLFLYGPVWFIIIFVTITMILVHQHVRAIEKRASKWSSNKYIARGNIQNNSTNSRRVSFQEPNNNNMRRSSVQSSRRRSSINSKSKSQRVATQGFLYFLSFMVTWLPMTILRVIHAVTGNIPYWILVTASICVPLQGFINFFVYVRPRILRSEWYLRLSSSCCCCCCISTSMLITNASNYFNNNSTYNNDSMNKRRKQQQQGGGVGSSNTFMTPDTSGGASFKRSIYLEGGLCGESDDNIMNNNTDDRERRRRRSSDIEMMMNSDSTERINNTNQKHQHTIDNHVYDIEASSQQSITVDEVNNNYYGDDDDDDYEMNINDKVYDDDDDDSEDDDNYLKSSNRFIVHSQDDSIPSDDNSGSSRDRSSRNNSPTSSRRSSLDNNTGSSEGNNSYATNNSIRSNRSAHSHRSSIGSSIGHRIRRLSDGIISRRGSESSYMSSQNRHRRALELSETALSTSEISTSEVL